MVKQIFLKKLFFEKKTAEGVVKKLVFEKKPQKG